MALYVYQCRACGRTAEMQRPVGDRNVLPSCVCTAQTVATMRRVLTVPASVWHPTKSKG